MALTTQSATQVTAELLSLIRDVRQDVERGAALVMMAMLRRPWISGRAGELDKSGRNGLTVTWSSK